MSQPQPPAPLSPTGVPPQSYESPLPYQQEPLVNGSLPSTAVPLAPAVLAPVPANNSPQILAASALPSENRVILKDGTQVVIQQDDEIL